MQISLYNCTSNENVVHKIKSNVKTINGQLMDGTSVESPIIQIEYFNNINFNYVYIPSFNRYYYITDIDVVEGQHIILHLDVDVLTSFWDKMKQSPCIALRSSSNYNNQLDDREVVKLPTCSYIFRRLDTAFVPSDGVGNYILTLGGGN